MKKKSIPLMRSVELTFWAKRIISGYSNENDNGYTNQTFTLFAYE